MEGMSNALHEAVRRYAYANANDDGFAATPLPGVGMMRMEAPTGFSKVIYRPLVCLVLGGEKQVTVGAETHVFAAGQSALVSADVPAVSRVTRASRGEPYLAVAVELDLAVLLDLAGVVPGVAGPALGPVLVQETDAAVADCVLRLVRLLDRPEAVAALREPIGREHYWLLTGRHGAAVRGLVHPDGVAPRVARAVAVLRQGFDQPLRVEDLAAVAGMSASTFHLHFRAVTSVSPVQFQKQLRLIEARRLLLTEGMAASRAAYMVGYESVPQFTREYARMFGMPPGRDARGRRAAQGPSAHRGSLTRKTSSPC